MFFFAFCNQFPFLIKRIQIEGIEKDPQFRKHYIPPMHREDEEVNLNDVCAVFDDIEVGSISFMLYTIVFLV